MMLGREAYSFGTLRIQSKPFPPSSSSSDGFLLKANLRAPSINGSQTNLKMVSEKHLNLIIDEKERKQDMVADSFALGTAVKDRRIFSQNYTIRSYELGPNHTATIQTLMNVLQETFLNHIWSMGLLSDGMGITPQMSKRNLIWVLSKVHVCVDRYPSWCDDIQVNNWCIPYGKNAIGVQWTAFDRWTGQTLTRTSSKLTTMNKVTRRLSKMPEEVRRELEPHQYIECHPFLGEDGGKLPKLDHNKMKHVRTGFTPRWSDLDTNQHVNNVKYFGFMLESVPISFLESHELSSITMEYLRECAMHDVLQSLTSVCHEAIDGSIGSNGVDECFHLLCFENGAVVARGRTKWRHKHACQKLRHK